MKLNVVCKNKILRERLVYQLGRGVNGALDVVSSTVREGREKMCFLSKTSFVCQELDPIFGCTAFLSAVTLMN